MAIFREKKDTKKEARPAEKEQADYSVRNVLKNKPVTEVIRNPRITEKATMLTGGNVYTFDVHPAATKVDIKRAIREIYQVTPIKVRTVAIPKKQVFSRRTRGIAGTKGGGKKALVYLKEGDSIDFV